MDLQELLAKMTTKLNYAENRLSELENCYCERTCQVNTLVRHNMESWVENCKQCTCKNGVVECKRLACPPQSCPTDFRPVFTEGKCCKECRPICLYGGQKLAEGQRALKSNCRECRNRTMVIVHEACPALNCPPSQQLQPESRCCNVCRGHDFCAEGHRCGENSACWNLNTKAICVCKNGFVPVQGDSAYCEEHDECGNGQHNCDENAICTNTVRGHRCTCKPGYVGNGTICRAFCEEGCRNGGSCVAPNSCACPPGFKGRGCQTVYFLFPAKLESWSVTI